ncbi:MAG: hypothetical protein PHU07_01445 [Acidocella sp.]|nr:hypothetical protein [Acidocella sp.]
MNETPIDHNDASISFLRQEFDKFRAEIAGVKGKLSDNAHEALDQISAYLNGGSLSSRIASLEEELGHLSCKIKGTSKDAVNKLEHQVETRPLASIAIAFGAGVLATQLLRRK